MDSLVSARTALLAALIQSKGYGLELIDRVKTRSKGAVVLKDGSVYPALRALEKEGLVKSWEADPVPERGGRPRRYYELTAEGLRQARQQVKAVIALMTPAEVV